jgi:hypothetical protein
MAYSAPPNQNQSDTASLIDKYKKDSLNSKLKIDSLKKLIAQNDANAKPDPKTFILGSAAIYLISIVICLFLIYIANTSPKDFRYALGLPDGSIRAIIAILAILFYILISLALSHLVTRSAIPSDVVKTLGTLVVAISAFYFGAKTAEQGSKTATANLNTLLTSSANPGGNIANAVPIEIIQQAITANKKAWMDLYNCTNIEIGRKKTQDTTHDIDCIVFYVNNKSNSPAAPAPDTTTPKPIPQYIAYESNGKVYSIPTDVRQNPA